MTMHKEIDISHHQFAESWQGVRVIYNPNSAIALMEVSSYGEIERFRIDLGKLIAIDECSIDDEDLKQFIIDEIIPKTKG